MVHLHLHSMYSLRDSIIKPDDLIERLHEIGQIAVAVTDHGCCLGAVQLYKDLTAAGIKYIHGVEFYICDDATVKDKDNKYYHLVALCKNETGRINLNRLITKSEHPDHFYSKPRIDFQMLQQHSDGLIILSACLAGEISRYLMADNHEKAYEIAQKYKQHFGNDYYLEIQSHMTADQIESNKKVLQLADELSIPYVVTCDAHHTRDEDRKYQLKYAFNGSYKEDGESYLDCFVQSEDEVRQRLQYLDEDVIERAIRNTELIAEQCNAKMPLSAPIMPKVSTPPEFSDSYSWLNSICMDGFRTKLNINFLTKSVFDKDVFLSRNIYDKDGEVIDTELYQPSQEEIEKYIERYQYEMNALQKMGFLDYILLVYSYSNVGKRRGIARGSGGGSLVNYLTNITDIDPIEHKLYFERFIDVGALPRLEAGEITAKELKIPDIDLDFSGESCEEVLRFLYDTYGEDRVASIGKFGTNKTKGSIRDLCKVLDIDLSTADEIAKSFADFEIDEIDNMIAGEIDITPSAKPAIKAVEKYPELFEYVRKLNNLPKSFGLHACGKIISTRDLDDFMPSNYDANGIRYLQSEMHGVEDVGLVKIDLLGLRTLDQEYDTLEMSGESKEFLDPRQSFNDPKVLQIFKDGDTLGVFQMASHGMRQTLKKMNVSGIEDISAANALFRPGAMQYIDNFCRRKNGEEEITYLHPDLEPILSNTYGIIVFQEQLIEIGRLAKLHNPDLLRKATGKKNPKLLAEIKPELETKLLARGWTQEQFDQLWIDMLDFARYSFNKAHSSAYGIIAYMTAKQKAYYPAEFFAGLCNSFIGESSFAKDNAEEIIDDVYKHKIKLAPFSFRNDHRRCGVVNGQIVYGIPLIKDCNQSIAEVLYQNKDCDGKYFWRFVQKLMSDGAEKSKINILIKLGFFNEFGGACNLLRVMDMLDTFHYGERKSISKGAVAGIPELYKIVDENSISVNPKGVELKTFKIQNLPEILDRYEDYIMSFGRDDLQHKVLIAYQKEMLGFITLTTGKEEDRTKLFIKEIYPLHRKSDGKQFGYSIITQSVGSGKESRFTVFNRVFNQEPISKNDLILCIGFSREGQYFTLTSYKHIYS